MFAVRDQYALDLMHESFNNSTGEDLLHIVKESPISFYLTFIARKSSPLLRTFNQAILAAKEFGFGRYITKQIHASNELKRIKRMKVVNLKRVSCHQAITMGHIRNILLFYAFCIIISCLVFAMELLHQHKK